jgi:two-component system cell cycle sensor histidine kinase PleC
MENLLKSLLKNGSPFVGPYGISPFTIEFKDKNIESDFIEEMMEQSIWVIRMMGILGILSFGCFAILDYLTLPESYQTAWLLRFLIGFPICIGSFAITYTNYFRRNSQIILSICMISVSLTVILIIYASKEHEIGRPLYYAGLIHLMLFSYILRLKTIYGSLIFIISILIYNLISFYSAQIDQKILVNNNIFLLFSFFIGLTANIIQDIHLRVDYVRRQRLEESQRYAYELYQQAQTASKAKSDFLAIISHELRTPLNAVIGFSEIMSGEMLGPIGIPKYREYAQDITNSGRHLLSIINDIIDFTKLESGSMTLNKNEVDLIDIAHTCLKMVTQKAGERNVHIALEAAILPIIASVDERLIRQAIINLLTNAIKFSDSGDSVTLSISIDGEHRLCIAVSDEGIGIAPENLTRIFQPFVQVEDAMTRNFDGMGLGLPLVKQITELHGGSIAIASKQGEGTTVILQLPPLHAISQ